MSQRYDELERLQRLRESGALTDEEFQAEKRRLLGYDMPPVQERVTEVDAAEPRRSRTPLYVGLGAGGVAIAVAIGLLIGRTAGGGHDDGIVNLSLPAPADAPADTNLLNAAPPPAQDVRSLAKAEQLGRAFAAAFGGATGEARAQVNGQTVVYKPKDLFWIGDRAVLVSAGPSTDDCHACAGALAVHYLKANADKFEVTGSWPNLVGGAGWGKAPQWKLTNAFTSFPAIFEEGSGMGQGYVCASATLTELAPSGPVSSGPIPLHYDNEGAVSDDAAKVTIDGKIVNVKKDVSFDVAYAAAEPFTETWVRRGGKFVLQGGQTRVTQC
ncbi:MAG: SHOCT domain-containing protein [Alphaproteobacteria bacterium]|nr:SHOCT domain-containing protein [Alphaproteobacteria bacterium]